MPRKRTRLTPAQKLHITSKQLNAYKSKTVKKDTRSANVKLADAITSGRQQIQSNVVQRGNEFIVDNNKTSIAGLVGYLSLADKITDLVNDKGYISNSPLSKMGAQKYTLKTLVENYSRIVQAGTSVIYIPNDLEPITAPGTPIFVEQNVEFVTIEPADFTLVELDDGEAPLGIVPISTAKLDRSNLSDYSFRFKFSRRDQKARETEQLASEILMSIALGMGRAIDKEMCRALLALELNEYNKIAAVSAGANHSELFGLLSANGPFGSEFPKYEAGKLIMEGVPTEYCNEAEASLIAAWSRFSIAIPEEVNLLVERRDAAGNLIITVWFSIQALIPNKSFAWKV